MKIKNIITEQRTFEKEISLPYYGKDQTGNKFWVISEDEQMISIDFTANDKMIFIAFVAAYLRVNELEKAIDITEQEFSAAYYKALDEMSKYVPAPAIVYFEKEN